MGSMSAEQSRDSDTPAESVAPGAAADDVLAAAHRRAAALSAADAATLASLLHPEFRWTSHRGEVLDRETYIRNNTGGAVTWQSQSLADVHVTVVDRVGVLTAVVTDEVVRDGTAATFRMPMTQTWVRLGRQWRCLAGHAGPLL